MWKYKCCMLWQGKLVLFGLIEVFILHGPGHKHSTSYRPDVWVLDVGRVLIVKFVTYLSCLYRNLWNAGRLEIWEFLWSVYRILKMKQSPKLLFQQSSMLHIKGSRLLWLIKKIAMKYLGSVCHISHCCKQRLHYPKINECYRACSTLIMLSFFQAKFFILSKSLLSS